MSEQPVDKYEISAQQPPIIIDPRILNNYYNRDDKISLGDLWRLLVGQKKVFWITFFVVVCTGIFAFGILPAPLYHYTTTIEIGTKADKETLIQTVESLKSVLKTVYVNQALNDYYKNDISSEKIIDVDVETPQDTDLLVIKSIGSAEQESTHLTIHQKILDALMAKHDATTQAIIDDFQSQKLKLQIMIEDLENEEIFARRKLEVQQNLDNKRKLLQKLKEEKTNFEKSIHRLSELKELLRTQHARDLDNLGTALENQKTAAKSRADTSLLVILTSELQQYRTHIASLEERITIELPVQEEKLLSKIADNLRAQESQKLEILQAEFAVSQLSIDRERELADLKFRLTKLKHDMASLPSTHAVLPPGRSVKPINNRKWLVITLSFTLGLIMAVCAALFADFLAKDQSIKS